MARELNNYAFIDSQNLNKGMQALGWKLNYKKFRVYLQEKYHIQKAYIFIGFVANNEKLYIFLERAGFTLKFKPTIPDKDGKIKGNVDSDLVLQVLVDWHQFNKALIISGDGDFCSLVDHLYVQCKLETVLSPFSEICSALLRQSAREKLCHMNQLKKELEYEKRS